MSKRTAIGVAAAMAVAILVPTAAVAFGQKPGPCQVTVECPDGTSVSCFGQTVCYYKYTSSSGPGFVECDRGPRISCDLL